MLNSPLSLVPAFCEWFVSCCSSLSLFVSTLLHFIVLAALAHVFWELWYSPGNNTNLKKALTGTPELHHHISDSSFIVFFWFRSYSGQNMNLFTTLALQSVIFLTACAQPFRPWTGQDCQRVRKDLFFIFTPPTFRILVNFRHHKSLIKNQRGNTSSVLSFLSISLTNFS